MREGEVRYQNDIGRGITVRVRTNEGEDYWDEDEAYDWEIVLDDDSVVYFNTKRDFYDWIDRLKKTFPRPEPMYLRKDTP